MPHASASTSATALPTAQTKHAYRILIIDDDPQMRRAVARLLRLLADRLEEHLDGEELAFESLGDALETAGFSADDIQAVAIALRQLATVRGDGDARVVRAPAADAAHRRRLGQPG